MLGEGGNLVLGEAGKLCGITMPQLENGDAITALSEILLDSNSRIDFGEGGFIILGVGGNIRYASGTTVTIEDAQMVNIASGADGLVTINAINSYGALTLATQNSVAPQYNTTQPVGGVYLKSSDALSQIDIDVGSIILSNNIATSVMTLIGSNANEVSTGGNDEKADCGAGSVLTSGRSVVDTSNLGVCVGNTITPNTGGTITDLPTISIDNGANAHFGDVSIIDVGQPNTEIKIELTEPKTTEETPQPFSNNPDTNGGGGGMTALSEIALLLAFVSRQFRQRKSR